MDKNIKPWFVLLRYLFILLLGIGNLFLIYLIFTPLTIYPVYHILNLFYDITLLNNSIILGNQQIDIINACIAGSAYFLLFILNFSTPMKPKQRIYSLIYSLFLLLVLNILRIIILSILLFNNLNPNLFEFTHKLFWYGLSTIFVIAIWFSEVKLFKIKDIPIYSDFMFLKKLIKK